MGKKLFVVSDIHGYYTEMVKALDEAGFDKKNPEHKLICCGDYFDRGTENIEVMKYFERLPGAVLLRGNHEDLLLKLLETGRLLPHNYINGTINTVTEFFGKYAIDPLTDTVDFSGKTSTADRLYQFIQDTWNYYETDKYVFVHAWLPADILTSRELIEYTDRDWEKARWIRWSEKYTGNPPLKDKILVCGHMPTFVAHRFDKTRTPECSDIFYGNGMIAIDACTHSSKRVNVLVLNE